MPQPIAAIPDGVSPATATLLRAAREALTFTDGLSRAQQAVATAVIGTALDRAAAGHTYCYFLFRSGALEEVISFGETVLPRLKAEHLHEAYAEVLRWVGLSACEAGRFGTAIRHATESYRFADAQNDERGRILAFSLLGGCFERSGDPWQGERLLRDGLALARKRGEPYALLVTLNNLAAILIGKFYSLRDGWAEAEARVALEHSLPLAREVLALAPALNDRYFDALTLGNLGELLVHTGDLNEADRLLSQSLAQANEHGFRAVAQRIRCSVGELYLARGHTGQAKVALSELLTEQADPPPVSTKLRVHYGLYLAHRFEGDSAAALGALESFRRLESERSMQQLKAKSELMVTRLEADETQRKGLEQAHSIAQVHATRAVELERMALQDELTGLGNRRALDLSLPDILKSTHANQQAVAVVVLDIDHFKRINDAFGHTVGDRVLTQIARLLGEHCRAEDVITRFGGEEFVKVMPNVNAQEAFDICERLRLRVYDFPWSAIAPQLSVTLSAGIACAPLYDAASLLERADLAMYRAKRAGRNRVAVAP